MSGFCTHGQRLSGGLGSPAPAPRSLGLCPEASGCLGVPSSRRLRCHLVLVPLPWLEAPPSHGADPSSHGPRTAGALRSPPPLLAGALPPSGLHPTASSPVRGPPPHTLPLGGRASGYEFRGTHTFSPRTSSHVCHTGKAVEWLGPSWEG